MADRSDRTFDPTPQRLRKAREEGNVFRARELVAVGMLLVGLSVMVLGFDAGFGRLQQVATITFRQAATFPLSATSLPMLLGDLGRQLAILILPLFGILAVMALGLNVVQSGWNISFKTLEPKPEKISPAKGLQRIFSSRGVWELGKGLTKILLVGPLAYAIITARMPEIAVLHLLPLESVFATTAGWILLLSFSMALSLLALSGLDFAFEKWKYKEDLKMTAQEVKDEAKENEGNPEVKKRRFQMARELVRRPRLDHAVMQADVVVTNPTHYAVALRYDPEAAPAPRVLVKGIRKRALRIKGLAKDYGIPTVEDRPLARALYNSVPEQHEIPEELYPAVAALLAEIYRQRDAQS